MSSPPRRFIMGTELKGYSSSRFFVICPILQTRSHGSLIKGAFGLQSWSVEWEWREVRGHLRELMFETASFPTTFLFSVVTSARGILPSNSGGYSNLERSLSCNSKLSGHALVLWQMPVFPARWGSRGWGVELRQGDQRV